MSDETQIAALSRRIDELERQLGIQQDIHAVRRLQYAYGYFIDKSQYAEVVDLFSDQGEVWFLGGIYRGKRESAGSISNASGTISPRATTVRATDGCSITCRSR